MKKNLQKGFLLIEALLVTLTVSGILLYLYFQFSNINNSYNLTYRYNTVEDIYAVSDLKTLFLSTSTEESRTQLQTDVDSNLIKEIMCSSSTYWNPGSVCSKLYNELNIQHVYVTKADLTDLSKSDDLKKYSETFRTFVSHTNYDSSIGYRIIVEFNNQRAATLTL